jgi:type IV secretion system protein VirB5
MATKLSHPDQFVADSDPVGDEVFAARSGERSALKLTSILLAASLAFSVGANVMLSTRRPIVRYVRIDSIGRATAIAYSDLSYTPKEAEIRRFLEDWTKGRYARLRATVAQTYQASFYFVDRQMASKVMQQDLKDKTIAKIATGQTAENDIAINSIQFLSFAKQSVNNSVLATGQALIDFQKVFAPGAYGVAHKEHWLVSVTFYLNPEQIALQAEKDPRYESLNPLGLTITDFHETQVLNQ